MEGALHDGRLIGRRDLLGSAGPGTIGQQCGEPVSLIAVQPEGHGRPRHAKTPADGGPRLPGRRGEDNLGALHDAMRRRPDPGQVGKAAAIAAPKLDAANGKGHDLQDRTCPCITQDTLATLH